MKKILSPTTILVVAVLCPSCSLIPLANHTITGNIVINYPVPEIPTFNVRGGACSGEDYGKTAGQLKTGSQVVVKGSKGEILGLGQLEQGTYFLSESQEAIERFRINFPNSQAAVLSCRMSFTVKNVSDSDFYTFDIGRDSIPMSKKELEDKGYKFELSIQ